VDLISGLQAFSDQFESGGAVLHCHGVDFRYHECEILYDSANVDIGAFQDAAMTMRLRPRWCTSKTLAQSRHVGRVNLTTS
jgi:hypothetical protein